MCCSAWPARKGKESSKELFARKTVVATSFVRGTPADAEPRGALERSDVIDELVLNAGLAAAGMRFAGVRPTSPKSSDPSWASQSAIHKYNQSHQSSKRGNTSELHSRQNGLLSANGSAELLAHGKGIRTRQRTADSGENDQDAILCNLFSLCRHRNDVGVKNPAPIETWKRPIGRSRGNMMWKCETGHP
jgi:hypothetical protein